MKNFLIILFLAMLTPSFGRFLPKEAVEKYEKEVVLLVRSGTVADLDRACSIVEAFDLNSKVVRDLLYEIVVGDERGRTKVDENTSIVPRYRAASAIAHALGYFDLEKQINSEKDYELFLHWYSSKFNISEK